MKETEPDSRKRRIRPLLLILLWVWAILVFLVIDLFLEVDEFDRVRPDSALYEGMRRAGHEMVGTPYPEETQIPVARKTRGFVTGTDGTKVELKAKGRPVHRHLARGVDRTYVKYGTFTQWNDPKGTKSAGEYKDLKRHGAWVWVWPDGRKMEERHYENGVLHGKVTIWYETGQVMGEEEYHLGTPNGAWKTWHPNGRQAADERYKNGVLDGQLQHWHANGQVAAKASYAEGTPLGVVSFWHANGQLAERGEFVDGKRTGQWTSWDERGRVSKEELYEAGKVRPR